MFDRAAYQAGYLRTYIAIPRNRIKILARAAIVRAKKRGLPFDEDLKDKLSENPPTHCACCNALIDYSVGGGLKPLSPTLDRWKNDAGYVVGNVFVLCNRCNRLKNDENIAELEAVLKYMKG